MRVGGTKKKGKVFTVGVHHGMNYGASNCQAPKPLPITFLYIFFTTHFKQDR